jgi:hypothetical protein
MQDSRTHVDSHEAILLRQARENRPYLVDKRLVRSCRYSLLPVLATKYGL